MTPVLKIINEFISRICNEEQALIFSHMLESNQITFIFTGCWYLTQGTDLLLDLVAFSWPRSEMTATFICFSTTSNLAHMCFLPCLRNRDSGGICVAHHLRLSQNSSAVTLKHGRVEPSFLAAFSPQPRAALTLIERRDQIE